MDSRASQWIRSGRGAPAVLVGLGAALRVIWCILRPTSGAAGEATKVAAAIAEGRGFADAYGPGQGPTAHLLPISPGWAGLIYSLFGFKSAAAEFVLAAYSIGLALGTYLILYRVFMLLGVPRRACLLALAFGCLAPVYLSQEAVDFRTWEGGLAAFLAACFLLVLVEPSIRSLERRSLLAAALASLLFFVNPPLGGAAFICALIYGVRMLSWAQFARASLYSAIVLAGLIGPWAWRNEHVMHTPILLRSNAGLELALADYPGALDGRDRRGNFLNRIAEIHPSMSHAAFARMQHAGGEVAYARLMGNEARQWIVTHPAAAAGLFALHIRQMLIPQPWQFDVYGRAFSPAVRASLADLAGLLGLAGIALMLLIRRKPAWLYPAAIVLVPALLTAPFQPVPRYTYLIYPTLIFCAAAGLDLMLRTRKGSPSRPLEQQARR